MINSIQISIFLCNLYNSIQINDYTYANQLINSPVKNGSQNSVFQKTDDDDSSSDEEDEETE